MAFSTKATISTATTTTTISTWTQAGNGYEIAGGLLALRSGGSGDLISDYSTANVNGTLEGNQQFRFRFIPGSVKRFSFAFRRKDGGNYIQVYWGNGGSWDTIRVAYVGNGFGLLNQDSSSWGLTNGTSYDAVVSVTGTGASTVFTATIYNTSGTQVFQFILGTGGTAWTDSARLSDKGDFRFIKDVTLGLAGYNGTSTLDYQTEGTVASTTTSVYEKNTTHNSVGVTIAIAGGIGPYTITASYNGTTISGFPTTTPSTGNYTITKTGLSANRQGSIAWTVTGTSGGSHSSTAAVQTEPLNLDAWRSNGVRSTDLGDSITRDDGAMSIGGLSLGTGRTPGDVATLMTGSALGGVLGTALATGSNRIAISGGTSAEVADLLPEIVDTINGNGYDGPTLEGDPHPAGKVANIVRIRFGTNDSARTPAQTVATYQQIIDGIRADCPHDPLIMVGRITGDQGGGTDIAVESYRKYAVNVLLEALHDPANGIIVEGMLSYWPGVLDPANIPDNLHPGASYRGELAANWHFWEIGAILELEYVTSAYGAGSGGGLAQEE